MSSLGALLLKHNFYPWSLEENMEKLKKITRVEKEDPRILIEKEMRKYDLKMMKTGSTSSKTNTTY